MFQLQTKQSARLSGLPWNRAAVGCAAIVDGGQSAGVAVPVFRRGIGGARQAEYGKNDAGVDFGVDFGLAGVDLESG